MASGPNAALSPYHPSYRQDSGGGMPPRPAMTPEQLFLAELAVIERVIAWVCVRRGLRGADAEDFGRMVKIRLIENDYEVLAQFEAPQLPQDVSDGRDQPDVYLDYQVQRFGKWRPSAEARRLGPIALRLERLMYRDGLSFDEACGVLLSDTRVGETRDALYAMSAQRFPTGGREAPLASASGSARGRARGGRASRAPALAERIFGDHPAHARGAAGARPRVPAPSLRVGLQRRRRGAGPGPGPKGALPQEGEHPGAPADELEREGIGAEDAQELALERRLGRGPQRRSAGGRPLAGTTPGRVRLKVMDAAGRKEGGR